MKTTCFSTLLLILVLFSCAEKKKEDRYAEARKIYDEAISIHDEVMPKMGKIMNLQKSLKSIKKEINEEEKLEKIETTVNELDEAHTAMMQWMRNLTRVPEKNGSEENISSEEMTEIQKRSLEQIKEVKNKINTSIKNAESLTEKFNN